MKKLLLVLAILFSVMIASPVSATTRELLCDTRHDITKMVSAERAGRYQVDYVMWRESRCRQVAFNPNDPMGGSYGLFQINAYWCKPSRYYKRGWLQAQGILDNCKDLFNPVVNARAFIAIFDYAEKTYGNGWLPWGGTPRWN
jgi:hypothetical protein